MEAISAIWDATKCLCDCSAKHAAFICHLEDNLHSLTSQWIKLQNRSQDVKSRLQLVETRPHMRRTKEVDGWLQSVDSMEQTIEDIKKRGAKVDQYKCLGKFCHKNCLLSYCLGKEVVKTLDLVKVLTEKGERFDSEDKIVSKQPREPVDDMPVPKTVGTDLMLKKVWDSIEKENVGLIGLYGIGGIGKTTLMKRLYNEFVKRQDDSTLVIWVVVSKDRDINKIMEKIRQRCQIDDQDWKDKSRDEKEREIYNVMKQKKFVLLLDDVWYRLELHTIGVPYPYEMSNESKVLFTTRCEDVCDQMHAKKFKVECLTDKEAFDLFCMNVGEETINSDPVIKKLAKVVMRECKGLPLALITIGIAMAGKKNPKAWRHAIKKLEIFPSEVKDMEKEVFCTLKFSYDSLPGDTHKSCLLYFALFPEDKIIDVQCLIRLWIGEGLLGDDSIHDAINHGEDIVESLKLACLLEASEHEEGVKMHDVIRDMTIWLARDQDQRKEKILVQGEALRSSQETWKTAERISMIYHNKEHMTWDVPICPNLVTLIVDRIYMKDFANIQFMSKLKVLRLRSIAGITILPAEIGLLIHLEYLELSHCEITEKLPVEMKNLKRLKLLLIDEVYFGPEMIPLEVISCLKSLRLFSLLLLKSFSSTYCKEELYLEQLELLPLLEDLSISLCTPTGVNKLLGSTKLRRSIRWLEIMPDGTTAINTPIMTSLANMEHLERLCLNRLQYNLEEPFVNHIDIFCSLGLVKIFECHSVTHLTWLKYAPLLGCLYVGYCDRVEEVIMETEDDEDREDMDLVFANLRSMDLYSLPQLRNIYRKALHFRKLESIRIWKCPNLKNLPLGFNSATETLKKIRGEKLWWDNLEWEDPNLKSLFIKKFQIDKRAERLCWRYAALYWNN